jgi:hypothetical protein
MLHSYPRVPQLFWFALTFSLFPTTCPYHFLSLTLKSTYRIRPESSSDLAIIIELIRHHPRSSNLLALLRRQRSLIVKPAAIEAASLQGLPNELQLKIIDMVFSDPVFTSTHRNADTGDYYLSYRTLRDMRCSIIGLAGVLPHFRDYFLRFVRKELEELERKYRKVQLALEWLYTPLQEEVATMRMLVAYLETGDISKLKKRDEGSWVGIRITTKASDIVKSAFKSLGISRN